MHNRINNLYRATIILLLVITVTAAINTPDYETVKIKELELALVPDQTEYNVGETAVINIYLVNSHPYKVKVTLPDYLICGQLPVNYSGSVQVGVTPIIVNGTIIIDPYTNQHIATLTYLQRNTGKFEIEVGLEKLHKKIIIEVKEN